MSDILFKTQDYVFSYRVAGICICDGKVLLQKPTDDTGFAFPGGHVALGETNKESLMREFREEIGTDINVKELKWVAEIFFPWSGKACQQICLYYRVELLNDHTAMESQIPLDGKLIGKEHLEGRDFDIEFFWVPLSDVGKLQVYPPNANELLKQLDDGVKHFVYKED